MRCEATAIFFTWRSPQRQRQRAQDPEGDEWLVCLRHPQQVPSAPPRAPPRLKRPPHRTDLVIVPLLLLLGLRLRYNPTLRFQCLCEFSLSLRRIVFQDFLEEFRHRFHSPCQVNRVFYERLGGRRLPLGNLYKNLRENYKDVSFGRQTLRWIL